MIGRFAGIYRPGGASERDLRAVAAAVEGGDATLAGPVALASVGATPVAAGDVVCLLDGALYEGPGAAAAGAAPPASVDGVATGRALAAAWARDGDGVLARLRGDFALVLVDRSDGRVLLARDHMGGRGLLWTETGDAVAFASELRELLRLLPRRPAPDPAAVAHWLSVSGLPGERTLHRGVRRLPAACALRLDRDRRPQRYWRPERDPRRADGDHALLLRAALDTAVARRLGEDDGVLLSGGLDSGAVTAVAARRRAGLPSYSAVFPAHGEVDESPQIELLRGELGLRATTVEVRRGSVIAGALPYLRAWELPPISPNLFFWGPLLERAAADGVTALLDGEGGDELFGFSVYLLADRLRRGRLLSMRDLILSIPGTPSRRSVMRFVREYALKGAVPLGAHRAVRRLRSPETYAPPWLRPEAARTYVESDDGPDWKALPGPRWRAHLAHRVTRGMGAAYAYDHIRRRAALAGIEARHPLVDVDVVELVLRLPPESAFDPRHSRPLLRAATAGLLPDPVRLRARKSNFDAVFHDALAGPDLPAARALLGRRDAEVGAYVQPDAVRELLAAPPPGRAERRAWALHVWRLVTAECWLRAQADPELPSRLLGRLAEPDCRLTPVAA